VLALTGACTGSGGRSAPVTTTVPDTTPTTEVTTTVAPTTTTLTTVAGKPRPVTSLPFALGPGGARLTGTVTGPEGPVEGATIRVERLVRDQAAATTVTSGPGGQWTLDAVNGGRYRLRAWRPPDLAELQPVLVFVSVTETKPVTLTMARYGEGGATAAFAPNPPVVDQAAALVVTVSNGGVDGDGVLHASPLPGVPVQLVVTAGMALESTDTLVSDGAGNASYQVRCVQPGPPAAAAMVAGVRHPLELPACVPRR
jgi:hypothetical protein